jgi:hypothetical protein
MGARVDADTEAMHQFPTQPSRDGTQADRDQSQGKGQVTRCVARLALPEEPAHDEQHDDNHVADAVPEADRFRARATSYLCMTR